ncbi:DUF1836 domain-containing protein [Liquorilactobacillus mali]|uniref:BS ykrK family protein n=1 Tax=Liquorilactobacillus mali KCTC 3596 = DSM 20444 TaxID=1046596 RepID=A0A0R2EF30_9LACO|nr:DUF1836 domain-containing protein [Liquorilactobacillus mali]KRN11196.1 hypothetical protein FD00_GL001194 [Liquorilactobacillus mali KCTC 3596 = DSM 20444]MDC7953636.1 DUF1836 domain-containing protein [Liquorilactobacillus mali]MDV7758525.1 DUF1836 domain-containing protein [Liquorilactobacillus mali]QFQ73808.1 DUF1836 domain-containing protein [Liquorilactobacillus mali]
MDKGRPQLPLWKELPLIDLHLDQLITLTNNYLQPITGELITKTMLHNYFKAQIMIAPHKKKYQRVHLAGTIIIGLMKPVFSLTEIKLTLDAINNQKPSIQSNYDAFVLLFNTHNETANKQEQLMVQKSMLQTDLLTLQCNAVQTISYWLMTKQNLRELRDITQ